MRTRKIWLTIIILVVLGSIYFAFTRSKTPPPYSAETAINNGDIVSIATRQYNVDKLDRFVENVKKGAADTIVIVSYTTEGDAILEIVKYDGKVINTTVDNSRDRFAGSRDFFKRSEKYDKITVKDTERYTDYVLEGKNKETVIFMKYKAINNNEQ